ncbi:MAG TPA: UDP-N-acetylmuramoyl-L-alanyl-D-glutamate--2,6-diaminopimelate ligase [Thermoleophilaceae bacterium]
MTLRELTGGRAPDVEITGLAYSTADVEAGSLFFCVPGFRVDGHDFAPEAVKRGAVALVCERPLGLGVAEVLVPSVREAIGPLASRFYGDPTGELKVVGITGTNGKTTTAFLTRAILEATGTSCGLIGTVKYVIGGREEDAVRTSPEALDLQRAFRAMLDGGDGACAMEVSSHALYLGRTQGIEWSCRVFTNLTQDHLDFHKTMEEYFLAKRRLFVEGDAPSVVNVDDPYGLRLAQQVQAVTYGIGGDADFRAEDVSFDATGARFALLAPGGRADARIQLPGLFNVSNALAAVATTVQLGVPLDDAVAALADAQRVPGRLEPVDEGQDFAVLVDYAHTPDSLENVLRAARELTSGTLHVVFGAGGDRDRDKRPLMGRAAVDNADRVIVTSDNPRSEQPDAIIEQILEGTGGEVEHEVDRRKAITLAIGTATPGDVIVIAGKGHEQGQEFENGRKEPFDDVTVAREALRSRLGAAA